MKQLTRRELEQMERHLTGMLKSVWKAQGVNKRVVLTKPQEEVVTSFSFNPHPENM